MENKTKEILNQNQSIVIGTIVHKYVNEQKQSTILVVSTGNADRQENYPKFTFFKEESKTAAEFNLYEKVLVSGHMQSYKNTQGEKTFFTQFLVGDKIEKAPKLLERIGLSGGDFEPPRNEYILAGVITSIDTPHKGIVRMSIKTYRGKYFSNVQAYLYTRSVGPILEQFRVNDPVVCTGKLQTSKKEKDGQTIHYQNVIITSIEMQ